MRKSGWLIVWYGPFNGLWYFMGNDGLWYRHLNMAAMFDTKAEALTAKRGTDNQEAARSAKAERVSREYEDDDD